MVPFGGRSRPGYCLRKIKRAQEREARKRCQGKGLYASVNVHTKHPVLVTIGPGVARAPTQDAVVAIQTEARAAEGGRRRNSPELPGWEEVVAPLLDCWELHVEPWADAATLGGAGKRDCRREVRTRLVRSSVTIQHGFVRCK